MSTLSDIVRPVGTLEKLYTARQVLGIYHSVIVTATYAPRVILGDVALYSIFCATFPKLLHIHPSLCCHFEGEGTPKPQFRRLDTIEFRDVLQIVTLEKHESLAHKLQNLHDQRWSTERKSLWRLVVMREQRNSDYSENACKLHVAFVYHHVIGDGLSGAAFHRSLLQILNTIEQSSLDIQQAPKAIDAPVSISLIEPIEKLISLPLSWLFLIKQAFKEYAPQWLVGSPLPLWAGLPTETLDKCPFRSRTRIVTIDADRVETLLVESRNHGVSLTSLFTATLVFTLANALRHAPRFVGCTPYTLRRVTETSTDEMVNQSTALLTSYPTEILDRMRTASNRTERLDRIWDAASFSHRQLQDELAECPYDNLVGLLPYVSDHVTFYQKKFGKARELTWEMSNLGVFKTTQESMSGDWRLESMTFSQGAQPVGPAFSVNCISVQDGPLTIALTWQDSVVDEYVIDTLAGAFADLPSLLRGERSE